jgi:Flp pilus assembly protein TadD
LHERGKYPEAVDAFREAIRLQPANALAHNWLGVVLVRQQKLDEAIAALTKAIRLQPAALPGRSWFGLTLLRSRPAILRRAVPDVLISSHFWLGVALARQAKHHEAIAEFTRVISMKPTYIFAYQHRAVAYRAIGDKERADRDDRKASRCK